MSSQGEDKKETVAIGTQSFEALKRTNEHQAEYWSARDLQLQLGYAQWRRFEDAIKRAIVSCEQSGNHPQNHFANVGKMVELGSGSEREVEDYQLSRFACYLIAQNGDPRKLEIANAQQYFAIQARKQELTEQRAADQERLELRKQTSEEFKALSSAAKQAGVQNNMFGVFHDAGYKGLYGGLSADAIKAKKHIPQNQLRTPQFKIQTWDAGWWQVRNALNDVHLGAAELKAVKIAHAKLKDKLLPQVYQLGFLVA